LRPNTLNRTGLAHASGEQNTPFALHSEVGSALSFLTSLNPKSPLACKVPTGRGRPPGVGRLKILKPDTLAEFVRNPARQRAGPAGCPGFGFYPNAPMPHKKPEGEHQFKVGDRVTVTLHSGQLVEGTVRHVIEDTKGRHFQVDYGNHHTALVEKWRVHRK
jgi:hypothetical protein